MRSKVRKILNYSGEFLCEVCGGKHYLEQHHISGRKIQNYNKIKNLINVCCNCHTRIHRGDIIVEKRVMTTEGYKILWHYKGEESITGDDSKPYMF